MPFNESEVVIGHGKSLAYADAEAGPYVEIPGTIDISLPERELGATELVHDDLTDYTKDSIPALLDPGTVDFTYVYGKTAFASIEAIFQLATSAANRATATKFWRTTLPDGATATFRGFLTSHGLPMEQEDHLVVEASIQVRGKMTFAAV
jgi:hypothetical protein